MGFMVIEPWSGDIVYSPTAIMRLENEGVPHPSPIVLLLILVLIFLLFIILVVLLVIGICRIIRKIFMKKPAYGSGSYDE